MPGFLLALVIAAAPTEVGVVFHVARDPAGRPALDADRAAWLLQRASELHAASRVRFAVARLEPLPERIPADVHTVADRNRLAEAWGNPDGCVHVFAMGAVDDKDQPGRSVGLQGQLPGGFAGDVEDHPHLGGRGGEYECEEKAGHLSYEV